MFVEMLDLVRLQGKFPKDQKLRFGMKSKKILEFLAMRQAK